MRKRRPRGVHVFDLRCARVRPAACACSTRGVGVFVRNGALGTAPSVRCTAHGHRGRLTPGIGVAPPFLDLAQTEASRDGCEPSLLFWP
jgi:hypothetical protein